MERRSTYTPYPSPFRGNEIRTAIALMIFVFVVGLC